MHSAISTSPVAVQCTKGHNVPQQECKQQTHEQMQQSPSFPSSTPGLDSAEKERFSKPVGCTRTAGAAVHWAKRLQQLVAIKEERPRCDGDKRRENHDSWTGGGVFRGLCKVGKRAERGGSRVHVIVFLIAKRESWGDFRPGILLVAEGKDMEWLGWWWWWWR